jgi:DNA-binding SARP family transcriptional activator
VLRVRYSRLGERASAAFRASGRTEVAERCYRNALEFYPVAEEIYRRWMLLLAARGDTAAALDVYRRCREALAALLGTQPSRETDAACERMLRATNQRADEVLHLFRDDVGGSVARATSVGR